MKQIIAASLAALTMAAVTAPAATALAGDDGSRSYMQRTRQPDRFH